MNTDEFFAEAKRLNLRMLGTPEETRAALDLKDAEIAHLRGQARVFGLWIAEALATLDTVEPEEATEAELLTAMIRRGEMLVLAALAQGGALGPNAEGDPETTARTNL